jgi:PAS domain S-box-containing protein
MTKSLFTKHIPKRNLLLFIENRYISVLSANVLVPSVIAYTTHNYLDTTLLYSWLFIHLALLVFRLYLSDKIEHLIQSNQDAKLQTYTYMILFIIYTSAIITPYLIWLAVLNGLPQKELFMLGSLVVILSAGALSTTVPIFKAFAGFVLLSMLPITTILLMQKEELSSIFALILLIFTFVSLKAGYKQHLLLENISSFKETFQMIYEKSYDSIILMKNNRVYDCNPATLKMFQFESKEQLLSAHMLDYMPTYQMDGAPSLKKALQMANITLKEGHNSFEWLYTRGDGSILWCDITLTKIIIDGEVFIHGVYRDITKKKELDKHQEMFQSLLKDKVEEEVQKNREKDKILLQQSRLAQMGEMISMIAHQWRQPLSAISAASGSIEFKASRNKLNNEIAQELSRKISQYVQHLSSTIEDFRNFFKTNKSQQKVSLHQLVASTINIVQHSIENKNIELITHYEKELIVNTYANEVQQVVLNIIKNAEDVLLEKRVQEPQIKIIVDEKTILIEDNGGGIDPDIMDKIFEPYFSTKDEKDGTGLGLYMSKIIIEQHCHGALRVTNTNKGALFSITV